MGNGMEWILRMGEPFFEDARHASRWITSELEKCVPPGWKLLPPEEGALHWSLRSLDATPGTQPYQDYEVRLTAGLDLLVFVCGNSVCGVHGLTHEFLQARVLHTGVLRKFSVKECLEYVMQAYEPNDWSAT